MQQLRSRQLKLFKLLAEEFNCKPTSYFSETLSVSQKTIYNDIDFLNQVLEKHHLQVDKTPRIGIMLKGSVSDREAFLQELREETNDELEFYSPDKRRLDMLRLLFIEGNELKLSELEQRYYVTVASLRNDIEILSTFLGKYSVRLIVSKSKASYEGSESSLQQALKHYILDEYRKTRLSDSLQGYIALLPLLNDLFDERIVILVKDTINHIVETSKRTISDYYLQSLFITLLIQTARIQNNHSMKMSDAIIEDISYLEPYIIAVEIAESFERQYGLKFSEEDTRYLSQQLFAHGIEPALMGADIRNQYLQIVDEMIRNMSHLLSTDLSDDEKLRDSLLYHIPPMIYRLKHRINVANPLLQEIKNQYIVLFSLTWYVAISLEMKYDVYLNDNEISFLFIYFQVSLEKRHNVHFKNIVIVCPIGLATSELIFTRIRQLFPKTDNVYTQTVKQLNESDLSNVDFVISTVKLDPIDPPVVYVSPLADEKDINNIMQHYSKLNTRINTLQQFPYHSTYRIKDFLHEDFVFWKMEFNDKQECLDFLINEYERRNLVTSDFGCSIYTREEMGDTSLYTGVAIPHAFPETVKKTMISVMTLKEKINWGVNDVNTVIVISVSQCDVDCIKDLFSKLVNILESKAMIDRMQTAKNKNELLELLRNEL